MYDPDDATIFQDYQFSNCSAKTVSQLLHDENDKLLIVNQTEK